MEEPIAGPYLQTAVFCEQVLEEKTGTISLIRIIDRIQVTTPPGSFGQIVLPPVTPIAVIALKSGSARGSHQLTIRQEAPNGMKQAAVVLTVLFEGEDRGVNVILPVPVGTDVEGLHWFEVLLDDQLLTKMPLRIVHQRIGFGFPAPQ